MIRSIFLVILTATLCTLDHHNIQASAPNILVILADDMGYGDLNCNGSKHLKTPHLDALAASGVFCSQAYVASSVCSPSRAGLLTGRDPRRFGYEGNLNNSSDHYPTRREYLGLPPGEHTLGNHLQAAGYSTALIGKWHLGKGQGFHPNQRGFDYFCGMLGGSHNYFPTRTKSHAIERNGNPVTKFSKDYLTDFFTEEGIHWLEKQSNSTKPWFLFMSYNAPHGPLQATERDLEKFKEIKNDRRRTYAAMMYSLDRGVGRLVQWLKENEIIKDTLIVFFSDNGGATNNGSWNGPLSGTKGCLKEGGIRIPMIWSWPGNLRENQRYDQPVSALDLLPTFMAAANSQPLDLKATRSYEDRRNRKRISQIYGAYDGINLLPYLQDSATAPKRTLFWRLQGQAAVLDGQDKLIRLSHRPAQFFQPARDPAETDDLAMKRDSQFLALFKKLGEWESLLPTTPLWDSSPMWRSESAKHYDNWIPTEEPD